MPYKNISNLDRAKNEWYNGYLKNAENAQMEETDMSFAAVEFYKGHLIGMADKKSTNYIAGVPIQDPGRKEVTKVWSNEKMVFALTGSNCFFTDDPDDKDSCRKIFLEDIMEKTIEKYTDAEQLCNSLFTYIRKRAYSELSPIVAIAFYEKDGDVFSVQSKFDTENFKIEKSLHDGWAYTTAGDYDYQRYFIKHNDLFLDLNEDRLRKNLDILKEDYTREYPDKYNPVGGKWDICIV